MKIIITGVPGSGKTKAGRELAKLLGIDFLEVNEWIKKRRLSRGYDVKRRSRIIDLKKLKREISKEISKKKDIVIESHLLCEVKLKVDAVVVLRCNPTELEKRLKKRKYGEEKIKENLLAEMLDYCTINAERHYEKVYEVESASTPKETAKKILKTLNSGKRIHYDYSEKLKEFLGLV